MSFDEQWPQFRPTGKRAVFRPGDQVLIVDMMQTITLIFFTPFIARGRPAPF